MSGATGPPPAVAWHDLECGGYQADLPLWRRLAARAAGPVLDVGAGAGRVALDLAASGHDVTALDVDPHLLEALRERARARGLRVAALAGDARETALPPAGFALCLVPMQTIQLLGGETGRAALLARARVALRPGGLLAAAIADPLEGWDQASAPPPPDIDERDGWSLSSQPVAVRAEREATAIERVRTATGPGGERHHELDVVRLDHLKAALLEREGAAAGFAVAPRARIAATDAYVGSGVVMLRA